MRAARFLSLLLLLLLGLTPPVAAPALLPGASPAASASPAAADSWVPAAGPVFNSPTGDYAARTRILRRIHAAIQHTPKGQTIRIATYNIDRTDTADLLLKAKARGVNVQVVVNANLVGDVERRLQARLGKNPAAKSFLVICRNACRNSSPSGNMHMKIYSFGQSGAARAVIIESSANLGSAAVRNQWNDAFTVYGDMDLWQTWYDVFRQLKYDRAVSPRRITYRSDGFYAHFQRPVTSDTTTLRSTGDAVLDRLRQVRCTAPAPYGDSSRRTVVRINMYAWYGDRGERLAREVASLKRQGCRVYVIGSVISDPVVGILKAPGIPVKAADWDWGRKLSTSGDKFVFGPRCYSHLKYLTVNGSYYGRGTRVVWTGSENWSAPAISSDEVTFQIHDTKVVQAYNDRFNAMWASPNATHRTGVKPTRRPCQ